MPSQHRPPDTAPRRRRSTSHSATPSTSKRPRTESACEACRSRKLACNGETPCPRCMRDAKECIYLERPERTPLTRARMTELEERIAFYEKVWDALMPGLSITDVYDKYHAEPLGDVRDMVMQHLPRRPLSRLPSRAPSRATSPRPPVSRDSPANAGDDIAPIIAVEHDPRVYEWHESKDPGNLDGMGLNHNTEEGISYLGLSSGTVFVNVIKRLAPTNTLSISPENTVLGNFDGSRRGQQQITRAVRPLPPLSEIRPYVDGFFKFFHKLTPLVHEPTIRAQITGALPIPDKPGQEVLLFMIIAMGAFDIAIDDSDPGQKYYEMAHDALKRDVLEEGSLQLVQGLTLMANYLQRSNRANAGHLTLGLAIRMAVGLGIHTSSTNWRCSPLEQEMRSRVWWSLVVLECGCAVTFGRPPGVEQAQLMAMPLPINCEDENLTVSTVSKPPNSPDVTPYSTLIGLAILARVTCSIHKSVLQSHPAPTLQQIKRYDARILATIESMPAYCTAAPEGPYSFAHSIYMWRLRDFRAILYRPILLAAAWDARNGSQSPISPAVQEAIDVCRALALDNLQDMGDFARANPDAGRVTQWYPLYFAFQSALALLLSVVWEPFHPLADTWRAVIHSTAAWFRDMHSLSAVGHAYARILENIVNTVPSPADTTALATVLESYSALGGEEHAPPMDVERYWLEIMGNELALPNANPSGWWDPFIEPQFQY